jgi:D-proline reductase (dithiol) PrdB
MNIQRLKNRTIAKLITRFPALSGKVAEGYNPVENRDIPWEPVKKLLINCKIAIVTTAGVHHENQDPFDMTDKDGDPTYRVIDLTQPASQLMITHDYYDHADADRDINIVFPIDRLKEFEQEGLVGKFADINYGFMGHIDGRHIQSLIKESAPNVAQRLKADNVDVVLLTPG